MVSNTSKFLISMGVGIFLSLLLLFSGYVPGSKGEGRLVRFGFWIIIFIIYFIWKNIDSQPTKKSKKSKFPISFFYVGVAQSLYFGFNLIIILFTYIFLSSEIFMYYSLLYIISTLLPHFITLFGFIMGIMLLKKNIKFVTFEFWFGVLLLGTSLLNIIVLIFIMGTSNIFFIGFTVMTNFLPFIIGSFIVCYFRKFHDFNDKLGKINAFIVIILLLLVILSNFFVYTN